MKKQIGIWMDGKEAVIITLDGTNAHVSQVKNTVTEHANKDHKEHSKEEATKTPVGTATDKSTTHPTGAVERVEIKEGQKLATSFQKELFELIKGSDEWYVCGPAEAKTEFKQFIKENHSADLQKLKAVENAEHLSSKELIVKVKAFFKVS